MEASDEVHPGGGPRNRPESSASSRGSRYTPQSSNSSFATSSLHRVNGGGRESHRERAQDRDERREPSGQSLLQERLREKKAARLNERRRSVDVNLGFDDRAVSQSSPIRNGAGVRQGRDTRPTSSGERVVGKKGMGVKEMEETVSTLHKQNFDLKLELFHRRQKQSTLEEQLEAAEAQIAEQAEMQVVNEQLLTELEKRDQAVEEAVGIICSLEEKIDRLEKEREIVRSFEAQYDPNYLRCLHDNTTSSQDPGSSPPRFAEQEGGVTHTTRPGARPVARMPSFLSEKSEGTEALRSLYLPSMRDEQSLQSLPKLPEEVNGDPRESEMMLEGMNSPRLSVLSESSFLSVYGDKNLTIESLDLDDRSRTVSPDQRQHRKSISIEKWVDERPHPNITPQRPSASKAGSRKGQFISLNDVLESPLQRLEKLERTLNRHNNRLASQRLQHEASQQQPGSQENNIKRDNIRRTEMTSYDKQHTLPPTPDTISTSTLRLFNPSNDTLSHDAAKAKERELRPQIERNNTMPSTSRSTSIRPRSAGETINSRRAGHGWDTATQSEATDLNSEGSVDIASTFDPWIDMGREKHSHRVQPPDMFNFAAANDDSDDEWGRDMMFNHDSGVQLPNMRKYERAGDRIDDGPLSDDTVVPSPHGRRDRETSSSGWADSSALGSLPSPNPPERRSSLAKSPGSKLRKRLQSSAPSTGVSQSTNLAQLPAPSKETMTKRSRITSKLFSIGRSESIQPVMQSSPIPAVGGRNDFARSQSYGDDMVVSGGRNTKRYNQTAMTMEMDLEGLHGTSATPPPISRYPRERDNGAGRRTAMRPTTSGSLESRLDSRQQYQYVGDDNGADGEREISGVAANGSDCGGKGRKWFGLGRNGSLRR